jgi:D-serine deaminase-like pyridoxal phosphate-dependent protein
MWQSTFEGSVNSSRPFQAIRALEDALTPALLILQDIVEANVQITLRLLNEDRNRWRPHIKTTKMASVIRLLIDSGIGCFKCSTTRELLVLCECNANDVLLAYPARGATAVRASEIAAEHTGVSCAALIDDEAALDLWQGKRIDLFVDLNPGMDRTGVPLKDHERIAKLVAAIRRRSLTFRGLHCYEGHLTQQIQSERITAAHNVYDQLLRN